MKFTLASSNQHKVEELNQLFADSRIEVISPSEKIEVVEDGESFNENAFKKAQSYFKKYKTAILADDSGLVVPALPDELGIYSARFGGEGLSDRQRAELLLEKLADCEQREAYFVCLLCFLCDPEEVYFFEGRVNGQIARDYRGEHGFGYDPVFIPDEAPEDHSLAMIPQWKSEHSHRAVAARLARDFFEGHRGFCS